MRNRIAATGLEGLVGYGVRESLGERFQWEDLGVDITNKAAVDLAIGSTEVDTVVNFAAFTDVTAAWKQDGDRQGLCYRVNVDGATNVAKSCMRYGKLLIQISTDYVYRGDRSYEYVENDPPDALDWYGKTKGVAESVVLDVNPSNIICRIAAAFGGRHFKRDDYLDKTVSKLKKNSLPPQFTDTLFRPTWIPDLSRALEKIYTERPSGIFNTVGESLVSPYQFAVIVSEIYGYDLRNVKKGTLDEYLSQRSRPYARFLNLSTEKVKQELGIKFISIEEAIQLTKECTQK